MSDSLRNELASADPDGPRRDTRPLSDAEREARIEQLLLSGLDQYFAGRYEQAINIWTRVAFLERGHGRARAYIERARSALAERQRESDELLHSGVAAYHAGNLDVARDLLTRAVEEGGPSDTALLFLQHLSRLDRADGVPEAPRVAEARVSSEVARAGATNWPLTVGVSAVVAVVIVLAAIPVGSWLANLPINAPAQAALPTAPLPIVRPSDVLLAHARALYADGHLRDALRLLDRIEPADPARPEADRLKTGIQQTLLTMGQPASTPPGGTR